ncbi:MAG TPA: hypothetical protein VKR31_15770 [Rhizomicrobium sp.]|nr:hypothetical protein [Rhizomicrobium sp.]
MQASFSTLKRESDLFVLTAGANIAEGMTGTSGAPRRPRERLLSAFGWTWLFAAGAAIVAVTWFVVHLPI